MNNSAQHRAKKAQEISQACTSENTRAFEHKGFSVELLNAPFVNEVGDLVVFAKVQSEEKQIFIDNPIIIRNPPILVPDGTYEDTVDSRGRMIKKPNYKEDPLEALKEIIITIARRNE